MPNVTPNWNDNENARVYIPKRMRAALVNHRWVPGTREVSGHYEPVEYKFQEYPKTLYHPKYMETPEPRLEQYKDVPTWREAHLAWQRTDSPRTVVAKNLKHERELVEKGWLPEPPERPDGSVVKGSEEV